MLTPDPSQYIHRRAQDAIANLSDQLVGYSEEIASTVNEIADRYEVSKEFALLIVQTAIEDMKVDVGHHKNYQLDLITDEMHFAVERIDELTEALTEGHI